jgi:hypothetical protein
VESALAVPGACEFVVQGVKHLGLPEDESVIRAVVRFLRGGDLVPG